MQLDQAYLIVERPAIANARYVEICQARGWIDNIRRLRASMPFLNPTAYRGISRNPVTAFPIADVDELREYEYYHVDVHTDARLKMLEIQENLTDIEDGYVGGSMLPSLKDAVEAHDLLGVDQRDNYEIIRISRHSSGGEAGALGYDIGYWDGDFFSLICDCSVAPTWHPPALEDLGELAQQLKKLNSHVLFDQAAEADAFRDYYKSKSWAGSEDKDGEFCIIRIDECNTTVL